MGSNENSSMPKSVHCCLLDKESNLFSGNLNFLVNLLEIDPFFYFFVYAQISLKFHIYKTHLSLYDSQKYVYKKGVNL